MPDRGFPPAKQREFAVTALAMGLSLNQALVLLAILWVLGRLPAARACIAGSRPPARPPARPQAARRCRQDLGLDRLSRRDLLPPAAGPGRGGTAQHGLVPGVEGRQLPGGDLVRRIEALDRVTPGRLRRGIRTASGHRRDPTGSPRQPGESVPLETGLDVFHTKREARRVLKLLWNRLERTWEQAEAASRADDRARRQGRDGRGPARAARIAWKKAEAAFQRYEQAETAWRRAEPALGVFRPDGQLNDRSWAEARIAAAWPGLSGAEWSKVRGLLTAEAALTFLDGLHRELDRLGLAVELARRWSTCGGCVGGGSRGWDPQALGGYGAVAPLVQQVLCRQLEPNWRAPYREVAGVLRRTVRASSAVECMNSVLRMHQSRHRTLTQGMLDLKRLYWNTRVFRGGKRKGRCPYEHLGLALSRYDFWGLIRDELKTAAGRAPVDASRVAA